MAPAHPQRTRVWIVDDSRAQADAVQRGLAGHYDAEVFYDGATALEALSARLPDVLILDWHMPHVSGLEVCRFVRETRGPADLPILILTATINRRDLVEAFDAGANDFVRKPFDEDELKARVAGLERSRRLHAQILAAEATLRDEARFRERFIAALAHDLRQPLSAIVVTAQAMLGTAVDSQRARLMFGAAQRMGRMIDDVLDFSRGRLGGGMLLRRTRVQLEALAARVVDEVRAAHEDRSIELMNEGDLSGDWDADRIAQVCSNLLENALKHGAEDSPVLVELTGDQDAVTMIVRNHGTPIPETSRSTLFDAFRQADPATAPPGLGLGLFIVDQIIKAHGGLIDATSDSIATTFKVTLPRSAATSAR